MLIAEILGNQMYKWTSTCKLENILGADEPEHVGCCILNLKTYTGILYYQYNFMKTKAADIITMQGNNAKGLHI